MYRFGSHVSCAGGLLEAVSKASQLGCQCLQIFVSPPRAWPKQEKLIPLRSASRPSRSSKTGSHPQVPTLKSQDPSEFLRMVQEAGLEAPIAHACYLINLASPDPVLWQRSVDAICLEWARADQLKLDGIVMHPGAHTSASVDDGLENIVRGIRSALQRVKPTHCPLLLENTAGQGTCLGWKIEQLGYLLQQLHGSMIGVCWDTCHALAAGYDFRTPAGMQSMLDELRQYRVLDQVRAIHINDSAKECGSRVDRHEHIGLGCIGTQGWKLFLKTPEFQRLPMYLETEKGTDDHGQDWDVRNLKTLRSLVAS